MLSIPGNHGSASPILEASTGHGDVESDDDDSFRPSLLHTKSDTNIVRKASRKGSPPRGPIGSGGRTPTSADSSSSDLAARPVLASAGPSSPGTDVGSASGSSNKRHISFNTFVEQCIAVDDPEDIRAIESSQGMISDDGYDDEEDDMLEMRSSTSTASSRSRPSMSRTSSTTSEHVTIAKIAPTTLKALGNFPSPSPTTEFAPPEAYALEHPDSHGVSYRHKPSYDFPSPPTGVASSQWEDEDEDYAVGFEYFSGPDLGVGDEYASKRQLGSDSSHNVGSYGAKSSPSPQKPQFDDEISGTEPKWRAGSNYTGTSPNARSDGGSGSGSTTATVSPSNNSTARPSPIQSPRLEPSSPGFYSSAAAGPPGRSILKIRPPGYAGANTEETSPTASYFNFNPSVATGIGGFGQGVHRVTREAPTGSLPIYDAQTPDAYLGAAASPPSAQSAPTSPVTSTFAVGTERGRSYARTGSNVAERSASRGTSLGSGSISPNAARSPVQIPVPAAPTPPAKDTAIAAVTSTDDMDVDSSEGPYIPQRSNTPTPHSSPQVRAIPIPGR